MATSTRIRRFKIKVSPAATIASMSEGHKLPLKTALVIVSVILLLGAIATLIAYFLANRPQPRSLTSLTPVTSAPVSLTLDLSSPDNNILVFDQDLLVSGDTSANAYIILSLNDSDQLLTLGPDGSFSDTIKLQEGLNQLKVTALDNLGNSKSEDRTIYYSTEQL